MQNESLFKVVVGFICCLVFLKSSAQTKGGDTSLRVHLNMPRFLYEGDRLEVLGAISNPSPAEQTGQLQLQLLDADANTSVDGWFQNIFPVQYFTVASQKTELLRFPIEVPFLFRKGMHWRMMMQDSVLEEGVVTVLAADNATDSSKAKPKPAFQIRKQLYLKRTGQPLRAITGGTTTIHIGDSLTIRLSITAGRAVAQLQLTDVLAATFAPATPSFSKQSGNVFWQTEDSTNLTFSIPLLRKGRSSFQYNVIVTHAGVFYVGAATLQAGTHPEQRAQTNASQIRIEE